MDKFPISVPVFNASSFTTSYNKVNFLGRGTFASVRKCEHEDHGEVVAKCFSISGSTEKHNEAIESVKSEAEVLSRLNHKNIVKIIGVASWSNCMGIIMSYIDHGNLEDFLMSTKNIKEIPWILRLKFAEEIADGLKYLHHHDPKKAFVHGDLKPQNILLTSDLVLKIADFGSVSICLATGATHGSLNVPPNTQHTLYYTAPELLNLPNMEKKTFMDVYSVGVIIYEIITRHRAYDGVKPDLLLQVIKDRGQKPDVKPLNDVESCFDKDSRDLTVFKSLESLMKQCWTYKPEERPDICRVYEQLDEQLQINLRTATNFHDQISKLKRQLDASQKKTSQESVKKVKLSCFLPPFEEVPEDQADDSLNTSSESMSADSPVKSIADSPSHRPEGGTAINDIIQGILHKFYPKAVLRTEIGNLSKLKKKEVNQRLYAMEKNGLVEKINEEPPEWRLSSKGKEMFESKHASPKHLDTILPTREENIQTEVIGISSAMERVCASNIDSQRSVGDSATDAKRLSSVTVQGSCGAEDSLKKHLLEMLNSSHPSSMKLLNLVKSSSRPKSEVNKELYAMEKDGLVKKKEGVKKPEWLLLDLGKERLSTLH